MNQPSLNPSTADRILSHLQSRRDEMIEHLRSLTEIETPSDDPSSHPPFFSRLQQDLGELDYSTRRLPGRETGGHLYARPANRRKNRPCQLVLGHGDTVWPSGTLESNPFEVRDGTVVGPGVFDMKAGLTGLIFALRTLRRLEIPPELQTLVLINSDEEIGSPESTRHIRRLARVAARCYVLEPASGPDGKLKWARKGVGNFKITVVGKAAHAGISPREGSNAIVELSRLVTRLNELNDASRGVTVNVGRIDGGLRANVVAPESTAEVDVRVPDADTALEIERNIRNLTPSSEAFSLRIRGGFRRAPMEKTPGNQSLFDQARRFARWLNLDLEAERSGGASDANTTSQFTPTLDGLGAVGGGAHETHEYVEVDAWIRRTALLALLVASDLPAAATSQSQTSMERSSHET